MEGRPLLRRSARHMSEAAARGGWLQDERESKMMTMIDILLYDYCVCVDMRERVTDSHACRPRDQQAAT